MIKWIKHSIPPLLICMAITALAIVGFHYNIWGGVESRIIDAKMRLRGQIPQTGNVVIAAIDDRSVDRIGRWPWPRTYLGMLVETLNKYGAKVIGFDAFFPEPYVNVPMDGFRKFLLSNFERLGLNNPAGTSKTDFLKNQNEFYKMFLGAEFVADPDKKSEDLVEQNFNPDIQFAKVLSKVNNAILGYYFNDAKKYKEYVGDINFAYKTVEVKFQNAGTGVPPYIKEADKNVRNVVDDIQSGIEKNIPYEKLLKDVEAARAKYKQLADNALKQATSLKPELKSAVENFFVSNEQNIFDYFIHDLSYLSDNPDKDAEKTISDSVGSMSESAIQFKSSPGAINSFLHEPQLTPNIALLNESCAHFGHVNVIPDPDGVIRHHYAAIHYGKYLFPSLAIKSTSLLLNKPIKISLNPHGESPDMAIGDTKIPLDENGRLVVNYFGPKEYPQYSIFDIIYASLYEYEMPLPESIEEYFKEFYKKTPAEYYKEQYGAEPTQEDINNMVGETVKDDTPLSKIIIKWEAEKNFKDRFNIPMAEAFKGKVILVGATSMGIFDLRVTPFNEKAPGVGIHAQVIDDIILNKFLQTPPWSKTYVIAVMILLAFLVALVLPTMGAVRGAIVTLALLIVLIAVDYFYFFLKLGYPMPISYQSVQLGAMFLIVTIYRYATEEREKRWIKDTFGRYLAPSVVEHLTRNPDMIKLGGEMLELTAFFSDIQGFSTISEKLGSPQLLVELLNDYLSEMAQVIEEYEGTIDKYEGDAIIAFWGAPYHFADHALKACSACLDQQTKLAELREKWRREGKWPEIVCNARVRMGVNTGPMVVGNMGSMGRMNYTIMGDAVNLASRLEGANKPYGTYIMISQDTYALVKDQFETRVLDNLRVVGKSAPVKVYELIAHKGRIPTKKKRTIELYNEGLEAYRNKEWQRAIEFFEFALKEDPDDGPTKTYIKRCQGYLENPPPPDWDGVFALTSK